MKILSILFAVLFLCSCGKQNKESASGKSEDNSNNIKPTSAGVNEIKKQEVPDSVKKIYGYYTGGFLAVEYDDSSPLTYENKITVSVDSVLGDVLYGHSVVAGNDRPFKGSYVYTNGSYSAQVSEPGDDKFDGTFSFTINPALQTLTGTWTAFKKDIYVTKRQYDLKKNTFKYDKDNNNTFG